MSTVMNNRVREIDPGFMAGPVSWADNARGVVPNG